MKHHKKKALPHKRKPKNQHAAALIRSRQKESYGKREEAKATGVFSGTRRGFGFVSLPEVGEVFVPAKATGGAFDGDLVCLRYRRSLRTGKWEGEVEDIFRTSDYRLVATLIQERERGVRGGKKYYAAPHSPRLPEWIELPDVGGAKAGDKIELSIPRDSDKAPYVSKIFGSGKSREANYEAILWESGIQIDFSAAEWEEAERMAALPLVEEGRRVRQEIIFTIDGADTKDIDDAISIEKTENGWILGVHIADVSEYVLPGTALDKAAMTRGSSVYFVDQVVPMLPPALSNGACSLHPGAKKLALSAMITLDASGEILSCRPEKSILSSRVQGVYAEVNDLFDRGEASPFYEKYREVYPSLLEMHRLYRILARRRETLGALEFEGEEAAFLLDEEGMPTEVLPRQRGDGEKMIEEFMLAANRGIATLMQEKGIPCVFRVHDAPPEDKLQDLLLYAHNLGLSVGNLFTHKEPTAKELSLLLEEATEKGLGEALATPLLRAMAKAKYSALPRPHFGLSAPLYCHFTSPIRRLSDLATHRILKAAFFDGEAPGKYRRYAEKAAEAASEAELRALNAERQIDALYKTLYLSQHIGEEWDARIRSITSFGIFAVLPNTCEGLIPQEYLPWYLHFDEGTLSFSGRGRTLRIADPIRIRIEEADIPNLRSTFSIIL